MTRSLLGLVFACLALASFARAEGEGPVIPADNPMTAAKIKLGRQLYFDKRISHTGEVSCNSCHALSGNGADKTPFSKGVGGQLGGRNSPTVWNAAFMSVQFWDGRAPTLEEQAKGPMINPVEMGNVAHDDVVKRIKAIPGYQKEFQEVFGDGGFTIDNMVRAIAAFERTLIALDSPYDRYMKGEKKALGAAAVRGMELVKTVGCTSCHMGPHFSGPPLPIGQGFYQKFPTFTDNEYVKKYKFEDDLGRFVATKNEADKHMWRVPSWRNVALTAPYFHNGAVATLDEAVRVMAKVQLNKELKPGEVKDIVAFLTSLTGKRAKFTEPVLPR